MLILGIESSCDDTSMAIVKDGRFVLSCVTMSQIKEHIEFGGVVPEIASRLHSESIVLVLEKTLLDANMTLENIDAVAVTYNPGLIGALLIGVNFAKGLSLSLDKTLIGVNHMRAHIASCFISNESLEPPFMTLLVSGGHTYIVMVNDYTSFKILGKTRDDAAGECLDKIGRKLGFNYPGGINVDKMSQNGDASAFSFPAPNFADAPYDLSFSGIKTAAINKIDDKIIENPASFCASVQQSVGKYLIKKLYNCAKEQNVKKIAICGGVSANSAIRRILTETFKKEDGFSLFMPKLEYCGDNGAMVAAMGYYEFLQGNVADLSLNGVAKMSF